MISDTLKLPYADSAGRGDQGRVSTRTGTARVRALTAALLLSAALTACETQPVNPVEWQQGFPWSFVDSGYWHTCALAETTAYCWGSNQYGELGVDPSSVPGGSSRPVAVVGGHQFSTIGTGGKHTCGLTVDGEALCWGFDEFGETGGGPVGAPYQFSDLE